MSLCDPCKEADHTVCIDVDQSKKVYFTAEGKMQFVMPPGRMYRSCDCQHGGCIALRQEEDPVNVDQTLPKASENT